MADYSKPKAATEPVATKSVTFLSASKSGMVATNAKRVRQWKRVGNTYYPAGIVKLEATHTVSDMANIISGNLTERSQSAQDNAPLSNLEGDTGSSHMQGTPKAQGHEADNLSEGSAR